MCKQSMLARMCLALVIVLAGWFGGRRLQQVIDAIPDSNDDFIFF
ncbi:MULTISPECIES: hypothetical protein [Burkholderiaceae]|uniref:Uncharacterized protein n=1 Tax=Caballeronia sordidicola TaxID=196367 RepID=A0A242M331_CABSO|nr:MULTISPECIES: hypothetical protein [Burkholderiaceae]OTP65408.1 hypothetical protein PAMC26577_39925 [Caballeronia sordidicola]